mmetsp:Transcript_2056/g.6125  ORF Transcript_2056/g.6125 Transcript_2056/m.6125 type:complete len:432 (-) Transcript_2056:147-1442(-)
MVLVLILRQSILHVDLARLERTKSISPRPELLQLEDGFVCCLAGGRGASTPFLRLLTMVLDRAVGAGKLLERWRGAPFCHCVLHHALKLVLEKLQAQSLPLPLERLLLTLLLLDLSPALHRLKLLLLLQQPLACLTALFLALHRLLLGLLCLLGSTLCQLGLQLLQLGASFLFAQRLRWAGGLSLRCLPLLLLLLLALSALLGRLAFCGYAALSAANIITDTIFGAAWPSSRCHCCCHSCCVNPRRRCGGGSSWCRCAFQRNINVWITLVRHHPLHRGLHARVLSRHQRLHDPHLGKAHHQQAFLHLRVHASRRSLALCTVTSRRCHRRCRRRWCATHAAQGAQARLTRGFSRRSDMTAAQTVPRATKRLNLVLFHFRLQCLWVGAHLLVHLAPINVEVERRKAADAARLNLLSVACFVHLEESNICMLVR